MAVQKRDYVNLTLLKNLGILGSSFLHRHNSKQLRALEYVKGAILRLIARINRHKLIGGFLNTMIRMHEKTFVSISLLLFDINGEAVCEL